MEMTDFEKMYLFKHSGTTSQGVIQSPHCDCGSALPLDLRPANQRT